MFGFIEVETVAKDRISRLAFHASAHHVKIEIAVAIGIEEQRGHVLAGGVLLEGFDRGDEELFALFGPGTVILVNEAGSSLAAAHEVVLETIPVDIRPGHPGSETRVLVGQQRLALEVIEFRFRHHGGRKDIHDFEQGVAGLLLVTGGECSGRGTRFRLDDGVAPVD